MATEIILIRHGQTNCNLKKIYSGFLDVGLNCTGRTQAKKLAKRLSEKPIHKIYASDRKRALQTAKILFRGKQIHSIPSLREVNFGVFEGLTYEQLIKKHPRAYTKWIKDPFSIKIPKGEHLIQVRKRVTKALSKIAKINKDKTVAVVSHGGAISLYLNHLLKLKKFWKSIPGPTSISVVEYKGRRVRIKLINDSRHLK